MQERVVRRSGESAKLDDVSRSLHPPRESYAANPASEPTLSGRAVRSWKNRVTAESRRSMVWKGEFLQHLVLFCRQLSCVDFTWSGYDSTSLLIVLSFHSTPFPARVSPVYYIWKATLWANVTLWAKPEPLLKNGVIRPCQRDPSELTSLDSEEREKSSIPSLPAITPVINSALVRIARQRWSPFCSAFFEVGLFAGPLRLC